MPMSPLASASCTSTPATAERSTAIPPSSSLTPRVGSPISSEAAKISASTAHASLASAAAGQHQLRGIITDHVDEHLLILGGCDVEQALVGSRADSLARDLLPGLGESATGGGDGPKAGARNREHSVFGSLAQAELVQELATGHLAHAVDEEPQGVTTLILAEAVLAAGVQWILHSLCWHGQNVTVSYILR